MNKFIAFFKAHWQTIALIVILGLAAYVRLYKIEGYMTFLGDEGRDVLVVKRMLVDGKFTLLGPTASVGGFFLGPIYYYFMLPFLWAWRLNPVGPAVMVGLVGTATVYLVFVVGKAFFNARAGLIASSLYALSPVVIAYSRSSWNPNIVPFFSTLLIYLLWRLVTQKRRFDALWIGVILGIGLQLHYLFLFLFVLVGLWYILNGKKVQFVRSALLTFGGFIVGYSPFLAFELRHGFPNSISIFNFIMSGKDTGLAGASFFSTVWDVMFRLFGRLVFRMPPTELWGNFPAWYVPTLIVLTKSALYISTAYIAYQIFKGIQMSRKEKVSPAWSLIGMWLVVCLVLFGLYHKPIYDYYFGIFFAVPFLLVGVSLARLMRIRFGTWLATAAWMGLLFFNWQGRPFVYPPNNQIAQVRLIAQTAIDKTDGKPFNFALLTDGNSDHAYRYFFEMWGRAPVTIENTQNDPDRKTVTDQLIIICEQAHCAPLGNSLWEVAGFGRAQIDGQWEVPFVKVYKLTHYKGTL